MFSKSIIFCKRGRITVTVISLQPRVAPTLCANKSPMRMPKTEALVNNFFVNLHQSIWFTFLHSCGTLLIASYANKESEQTFGIRKYTEYLQILTWSPADQLQKRHFGTSQVCSLQIHFQHHEMACHLLFDWCNLLPSTIFCHTLRSTLRRPACQSAHWQNQIWPPDGWQVQAFQNNLGTYIREFSLYLKIFWRNQVIVHARSCHRLERRYIFLCKLAIYLNTFLGMAWHIVAPSSDLSWRIAFFCLIVSVTSSGCHESSEPLGFGLDCLFIHLYFSLHASQTYLVPDKL